LPISFYQMTNTCFNLIDPDYVRDSLRRATTITATNIRANAKDFVRQSEAMILELENGCVSDKNKIVTEGNGWKPTDVDIKLSNTAGSMLPERHNDQETPAINFESFDLPVEDEGEKFIFTTMKTTQSQNPEKPNA